MKLKYLKNEKNKLEKLSSELILYVNALSAYKYNMLTWISLPYIGIAVRDGPLFFWREGMNISSTQTIFFGVVVVANNFLRLLPSSANNFFVHLIAVDFIR